LFLVCDFVFAKLKTRPITFFCLGLFTQPLRGILRCNACTLKVDVATPIFVRRVEHRGRQRVRCLYGGSGTRKKTCAQYIHTVHPHQPIISHNPENPKILKILIQTAFPVHSPLPPIPGVGANNHSPNDARQHRPRDEKCGNVDTIVIPRMSG
jgi:hypothetical protein